MGTNLTTLHLNIQQIQRQYSGNSKEFDNFILVMRLGFTVDHCSFLIWPAWYIHGSFSIVQYVMKKQARDFAYSGGILADHIQCGQYL